MLDATVVTQRQIRTVHTVQITEDSMGAGLGCRPVLGQVVAVPVGATTGGRAMPGLTAGVCSASASGRLLKDFDDFLREGVYLALEVDSRPPLPC